MSSKNMLNFDFVTLSGSTATSMAGTKSGVAVRWIGAGGSAFSSIFLSGFFASAT